MVKDWTTKILGKDSKPVIIVDGHIRDNKEDLILEEKQVKIISD
jgi:3,4-dihydroxy-2-butanone 4-phosphate synthase